MLWKCFFVRGPLNESNKRTPVVPSVVAHLSAAIIAYHENQFGSSPQMTNTAISAQLLQRLSKLDRWIPFPVHWQIAISPLSGDSVGFKPWASRRWDLAHQRRSRSPLWPRLSVRLTIKTQEAATGNHLTQTGAVADLIRAELPLKVSTRWVNNTSPTMTQVQVVAALHKQMLSSPQSYLYWVALIPATYCETKNLKFFFQVLTSYFCVSAFWILYYFWYTISFLWNHCKLCLLYFLVSWWKINKGFCWGKPHCDF